MKPSWIAFLLVVLAFGAWAFLYRVDAVALMMQFVQYLDDNGSVAMRFENLSDYPDLDFYLKYGWGRGNPYAAPPHLTRVRSAETILPFEDAEHGRRTRVYLLAVPHSHEIPVMIISRWDGDPADGCLLSNPLESDHAGSGYLVPYRVLIEDGQLKAMMQPGEWLPGAWSLWWLTHLPCIVVPVGFCVALGWFGARIARRLFPPKATRRLF